MATTTMRRKASSGGSGGDHSAGTQANTNTTSHGKRASTGGGVPHRQRFVDPSLMMSTKGSDEGKQLTGQAKNKSSDRLHRIGGGSSNTNLAHSKRSKSYSQIMNATGQNASKSKMRRGKSDGQQTTREETEDEEGWTSADQTTDTDISATQRSHDDESDEEEADEGLTFGKKNNKGKEKAVAKTHEGFQIGNVAKKASSEQTNPSNVVQPDRTPLARPVVPTDDEPTPLTTPQSVDLDDMSSTTQEPNAQHGRHPSDMTIAVTSAEDAPHAISHSPEEQSRTESRPALLSRHTSSASTHTLTGSRDDVRGATSSPMSTRSARKRMSLLPRESSVYAPPQLSTEYAFAGGRHGSEGIGGRDKGKNVNHRSSDSNLGMGMVVSPSDSSQLHDRISDSTPHYRFGSNETMERRRKSSVSSSRSSYINLPGVAPTLGTVSHDSIKAESTGAQTSRALEAMQRASVGAANSISTQSAFSLPHDREQARRSQSFESGKGTNVSPTGTGTSEAARLASKLRMTRGKSGDHFNGGKSMPSTASQMLANSGTKYFMGIKGDGPTAMSLARYNKPIISVFVNRQDDFKSAEEVVEKGSLFDENFTRASVGHPKIPEHDEEDEDRAKRVSSRDDSGTVTPSNGTSVRYVMEYGLSGPAIQKSQTIQALLSTCIDNDEFESSFAPALANAAGLGDSGTHERGISAGTYLGQGESTGLGSGGIYINGPNATPLHFIHGLTNTNDSPFPLDESEMNGRTGEHAMLENSGQDGEYVDAKNLRAVALTWAALNATKNHIVTRRYVDPMRESIQRVALAGGMNINPDSRSDNKDDLLGTRGANNLSGSQSTSYLNASGGRSGNSGAMTPGGSLKWGWRHLFQEHT